MGDLSLGLIILVVIAIPVFVIFLIIRGVVMLIRGGKPSAASAPLEGSSVDTLKRLIDLLEQKGVITKSELFGDNVYARLEFERKTSLTAPVSGAMVAPSPTVPESSAPPKSAPSQGEDFSGSGKWLTLVGVIAVLLGVAFFLQYAFANNLIGETGRVALGIFAGVGFLLAGDFFYRKHSSYASFITGGGIGILYLTIYASSAVYHLVGQIPGMIFMSVITATSVALAVRYNLIWIAAVGLLGGFLTPILLATGTRNDVGLWNYVALLDIGMLIVAYYKKWNELVWGSFIGTLALVYPLALGGPAYVSEGFWLPETYMIAFWALFNVAILIFYYFHEEKPQGNDFVFMLLNGIIFAWGSYELLDPHYHSMIGFLPFLLSFAYTAIALLGVTYRASERKLFLFPVGLAITFLTLVFPIAFNGSWVTISWFVEAVAIAWIGYFVRTNFAAFSIPVAIVAFGRLLFIDGIFQSIPAQFFFNERTLLLVFGIFSAFALGYILPRITGHSEQSTFKTIGGIATIVANVLVIIWFWGEIGGLVARNILSSQGGSITFPAFLALYALLLLVIGITQKKARARQGAVALFVIVIFKTFLVDAIALEGLFRISAFIFLGIVLLVVGYLYTRFSDRIKGFLSGN